MADVNKDTIEETTTVKEDSVSDIGVALPPIDPIKDGLVVPEDGKALKY